MLKYLKDGLVFGAVLLFSVAISGNVVAEEGTVEAFSSWQARGQIYPTGPAEVTFVGALSGVIYVKGDDASMDVGLMSCPATLVINTVDGSQSGQGKCVIMTQDGERIYAEFTCEGVYLAGCDGYFKLTGGTGDKTNISGGGPIQFRNAFSNLVASTPGAIIEQSSVGLAVWPALTYKLP